jgi:hypothetical protein
VEEVHYERVGPCPPTSVTGSQALRVSPRHPGIQRYLEDRARDWQARLADSITAFAGSMPFVYVHIVAFAMWMLLAEGSPWPSLTLVVSLEAIFLSTSWLQTQDMVLRRSPGERAGTIPNEAV